MPKFSEVQYFLVEDYLKGLAADNTEGSGLKKTYLKGLNMNLITNGSFWTDLYVSDEDGFNYQKIQAQIRKIGDDQFSFLLKEES